MKYKLGSIVTAATGKLGGMVAMGKGSGGVLRVSSIRRKHQDLFINQIRSYVSFSVNKWQTIAESDRQSWIKGAGSLESGYNLFIKRNVQLKRLGFGPLLRYVPSAKMVTRSIIGLAVNVSAQTMILTMSAGVPTGFTMRIWVSIYCSVGLSKPPNRFLKIFNAPPGTTTVFNVSNAYKGRFIRLPIVNEKVFFGVDFVNRSTGDVSMIKMGTALIIT